MVAGNISGDLAKAIAGGADSVMIAWLLAGTGTRAQAMCPLSRAFIQELPRHGPGSGAMAQGSADRYFQQDVKDQMKLVPGGR